MALTTKPNIIFLHSHNTGRFVEPHGHAVPTPNLQHLAKEGVMFRHAFSAAPTCSPSRASFLTGRYPHCCGMTGLAHRGFGLTDQNHHIARFLGANGYATALCGVEHVKAGGSTLDDAVGYDTVLPAEGAFAAGIAPSVCDYLRNASADQPFFMSVGTQETHTGYPDPDPETYPEQDARYCAPPRPFADTPRLREMTAGFKESARRMDACWGEILTTLADTGLDRNTFVFCFTDHGLQWPLHIGNVGEHGNAVFLVVRGPHTFEGGGVIEPIVSLMDIFPTVCDMADIEHPDWLQGESLAPLVKGETDALHDKLFLEQCYHAAYEPMRAVRTERHIYIKRYDNREKLVLSNVDNTPAKDDMLANDWQAQPRHQEMLYDVYFDPDQQNNLIDEPQLADLAHEMRQSLDTWMRDTNDPLCSGVVPLPKGARATNPDASYPNEEPFIIGE